MASVRLQIMCSSQVNFYLNSHRTISALKYNSQDWEWKENVNCRFICRVWDT